MKTLNHFFFSRGAVRVLALALIAQLAFAIAGSTRAQAQCAITTASGQFGAGNALTWELCNDGTLTISGTGEMTDLQYKMPWASHRDNIQSVIITSGVSTIGGYAFTNCANLTSVTILESVTSIERNAFYNCAKLTSVTIPETLTSIGNHAFWSCKKLASITIPESVDYIGDEAFNNCTSLKSITIPEKMTSVGSKVFYSCTGLTSINIPKSIISIGNDAFAYCSGIKSITFSSPSSLKEIGGSAFSRCSITAITLPESVTSIGSSAFSACKSLPSIIIPESVTSIGDRAFASCDKLTSINIPDKVTVIENSTFAGCSSLESIDLPDGVTSIGERAFSGCSKLTSITIPDKVTVIENSSFEGCSSLVAIDLPASLITIKFSAFSDCSKLTSINLPDKVTAIEKNAFYKCEKLTSIDLPDKLISIGDNAFLDCTGLQSIEIPASVTTIGEGVFSNCSSLTSITVAGGSNFSSKDGVLFNGDKTTLLQYSAGKADISYTIPISVKTLEPEAFYLCNNLQSVTIPTSVQTIKGYAFWECTSLNDITVNWATPPSINGNNVFFDITRSNVTLHIPAGSEDAYKAAGWTGFKAYVEKTPCIGPTSFGTGLTWTLCDDGTLTVSGTGPMPNYDENTSRPPWDSHRNEITDVVIESGVTGIGESAFFGYSNLTSVDIQESVEKIGMGAFEDCSSLTSVNIPESVTTIYMGVFDGCSSLTSFTVDGDNTKYSDDGGVLFNKAKTTLIKYPAAKTGSTYTVPESVNTIDNYAFEDCTSLTGITVSRATPPAINANVFRNVNRSNITLHLSAGAGGIAYQAAGWTGFGTYDMPECPTPTEINTSGVFWQLCNDGTLTISGNGDLEGIGSSYDGTLRATMPWTVCRQEITSVIITQGITKINNYAFYNCTGLTDITVNWTSSPPTVETAKVFENVNRGSITLHLPAGATQGDYESAGWSGFKTYDIPTCPGPQTLSGLVTWELCNGTLTVGGTGSMPDFSNASGQPWASDRSDITDVVIEPGVTTIGNKAFEDCSALASVTISTSVDYIGVNAFYGCTALTSISVPASVTFIAPSAFSGCDNLTAFTVDGNNTKYSHDATGVLFDKDKKVLIQYPKGNTGSSYTIPASVVSIAMAAFSRCYDLTDITVNWTSASDIPDINYLNVFFNVTGNITLYINGGLNATHYTSANGWGGFKSYIACTSGTFGDTNNLTWTICGSTLTIEGTGAMPYFIIPSNQPWYSQRKNITNIIIAQGVTSIGERNFAEFSNLESAVIPASMESIDEHAFSGCSKLETVDLSSSALTVIKGDAFANCSGLTSIILPGTLEKIEDGVFYNCSKLESVTLPASLTAIGGSAFYNSGLTSVILPENITSIGGETFRYCIHLETVEIPEGVTGIGDFAFNGSGLTSVTIPASVTDIGIGSFSACSSLTDITVRSNNGNYSSANGVLFNKDQTTLLQYPAGKAGDSYTVPETVTTIERQAFYDCTSLESVTFPASLTIIETAAFYNSGLTSVTLPASLTEINNEAFHSCAALTSVTIPASVTFIGLFSFIGCNSLTDVTVMWTKATEIPGINDVFNGLTLSSITLNVPAGTKALYEAKAVWKNFNIVEQAAAILTLSQPALSFTAAAGSKTVNVTANTAWTAVSSDASWLAVAPPAGTGNGTLTLTVTANTGSSARTGTVTVSDGAGLTQAVTVTQAGVPAPPPSLTLSPASLNFGSAGGVQNVAVTSNITWTAVSSDVSWLTVAPPAGLGNASLTVTVAANTGGSVRTGMVTVSDGGSLTRTVTVTQDGAVKPSVTAGLLNYDISPVVYDGDPHPVTVTPKNGVSGLGAMTVTYNGLSAPPVEAGDYTVTVIFDEGAAYAATTLVLGVRTVMQVFNPPVLRKVTLHVSGDIISQPTRGEYHVNSGGNFTFTLTLPSDAMPTVSTTRRVNGAAEELTPTQNANGSYTYTAWLVYSDMEITVTSTVGNTAIAASKVWASGGKIHITATSAGVASVYNAAGHPVATRPYTAGETVAIPLPKGLYFILSEGRSYKVIVRE